MSHLRYHPFLRLVPEVWVIVAVCLALGTFAWAQGCWFGLWLGALVAAVVVVYGWDTPVQTVGRPNAVLAPADGVVVFRREAHDPFLGREAIKLQIRLPVLTRYVLRAPIEGEVIALGQGGSHASALEADSGAAVVMADAYGGALSAQPVLAAVGAKLGQSRRCGLRRFCRTLDIYLPLDARVEVRMGQKVSCGHTVLATLLRKSG